MLNNLTGLRFYAAFWVFLYHFFPVYTNFSKVDFFEIGYLGVDVFFVLSGFILTYDGIEENCSFNALFETNIEILQDQIQRLLFL